MTYTIVRAPAQGTLTGAPPDVTYAPDPDFNGSDSFDVTVNDGGLDCIAATVSIDVVAINDPP